MLFKPLEFDQQEPDTDYPEVLPLYASLGHAVGRWGLLEFTLTTWFTALTGMPFQTAKDIFLAPQSFRGRLDLIYAALENATAPEDVKKFLEAALRKVSRYVVFRNAIVHGFAMTIASPGGKFLGSGIFGLAGPWPEDMHEHCITIEQLDQGARNFNALNELIDEARLLQKGARSPQKPPITFRELRQRVEQLPNEASSPALSKRQQGRERQLRAAARVPIPKAGSGADR